MLEFLKLHQKSCLFIMKVHWNSKTYIRIQFKKQADITTWLYRRILIIYAHTKLKHTLKEKNYITIKLKKVMSTVAHTEILGQFHVFSLVSSSPNSWICFHLNSHNSLEWFNKLQGDVRYVRLILLPWNVWIINKTGSQRTGEWWLIFLSYWISFKKPYSLALQKIYLGEV